MKASGFGFGGALHGDLLRARAKNTKNKKNSKKKKKKKGNARSLVPSTHQEIVRWLLTSQNLVLDGQSSNNVEKSSHCCRCACREAVAVHSETQFGIGSAGRLQTQCCDDFKWQHHHIDGWPKPRFAGILSRRLGFERCLDRGQRLGEIQHRLAPALRRPGEDGLATQDHRRSCAGLFVKWK